MGWRAPERTSFWHGRSRNIQVALKQAGQRLRSSDLLTGACSVGWAVRRIPVPGDPPPCEQSRAWRWRTVASPCRRDSRSSPSVISLHPPTLASCHCNNTAQYSLCVCAAPQVQNLPPPASLPAHQLHPGYAPSSPTPWHQLPPNLSHLWSAQGSTWQILPLFNPLVSLCNRRPLYLSIGGTRSRWVHCQHILMEYSSICSHCLREYGT